MTTNYEQVSIKEIVSRFKDKSSKRKKSMNIDAEIASMAAEESEERAEYYLEAPKSGLISREEVLQPIYLPTKYEASEKHTDLQPAKKNGKKLPEVRSIVYCYDKTVTEAFQETQTKATTTKQYFGLSFDAYFECGNLFQVESVLRKGAPLGSPEEYDLYLTMDPSCHPIVYPVCAQWFFFRVTNTKKRTYRFNIHYFTNPKLAFGEGKRPVMISEAAYTSGERTGWQCIGDNVSYKACSQRPLLYRSRPELPDLDATVKPRLYTLTFTVALTTPKDTVYFALDPPYSFSQLQNLVYVLTKNPATRQHLHVRNLCRSLAGNRTDLLVITQDGLLSKPELMEKNEDGESIIPPYFLRDVLPSVGAGSMFTTASHSTVQSTRPTSSSFKVDSDEAAKPSALPRFLMRLQEEMEEQRARAHRQKIERARKPAVVVVARTHGAEAGSSWVCEGLIRYLLSDSAAAQRLRENFVFYIVPMLNVDGVVNGFSRHCLAGYDPATQWANPSSILHPAIMAVKYVVRRLFATTRLAAFFDLRTHSHRPGVSFHSQILAPKVEKPKNYRGKVEEPEELFAKDPRLFYYAAAQRSQLVSLKHCHIENTSDTKTKEVLEETDRKLKKQIWRAPKDATARYVIASECSLKLSMSVEASSHDHTQLMGPVQYAAIGSQLCLALRDLYLGVEPDEGKSLHASSSSSMPVAGSAITPNQQLQNMAEILQHLPALLDVAEEEGDEAVFETAVVSSTKQRREPRRQSAGDQRPLPRKISFNIGSTDVDEQVESIRRLSVDPHAVHEQGPRTTGEEVEVDGDALSHHADARNFNEDLWERDSIASSDADGDSMLCPLPVPADEEVALALAESTGPDALTSEAVVSRAIQEARDAVDIENRQRAMMSEEDQFEFSSCQSGDAQLRCGLAAINQYRSLRRAEYLGLLVGLAPSSTTEPDVNAHGNVNTEHVFRMSAATASFKTAVVMAHSEKLLALRAQQQQHQLQLAGGTIEEKVSDDDNDDDDDDDKGKSDNAKDAKATTRSAIKFGNESSSVTPSSASTATAPVIPSVPAPPVVASRAVINFSFARSSAEKNAAYFNEQSSAEQKAEVSHLPTLEEDPTKLEPKLHQMDSEKDVAVEKEATGAAPSKVTPTEDSNAAINATHRSSVVQKSPRVPLVSPSGAASGRLSVRRSSVNKSGNNSTISPTPKLPTSARHTVAVTGAASTSGGNSAPNSEGADQFTSSSASPQRSGRNRRITTNSGSTSTTLASTGGNKANENSGNNGTDDSLVESSKVTGDTNQSESSNSNGNSTSPGRRQVATTIVLQRVPIIHEGLHDKDEMEVAAADDVADVNDDDHKEDEEMEKEKEKEQTQRIVKARARTRATVAHATTSHNPPSSKATNPSNTSTASPRVPVKGRATTLQPRATDNVSKSGDVCKAPANTSKDSFQEQLVQMVHEAATISTVDSTNPPMTSAAKVRAPTKDGPLSSPPHAATISSKRLQPFGTAGSLVPSPKTAESVVVVERRDTQSERPVPRRPRRATATWSTQSPSEQRPEKPPVAVVEEAEVDKAAELEENEDGNHHSSVDGKKDEPQATTQSVDVGNAADEEEGNLESVPALVLPENRKKTTPAKSEAPFEATTVAKTSPARVDSLLIALPMSPKPQPIPPQHKIDEYKASTLPRGVQNPLLLRDYEQQQQSLREQGTRSPTILTLSPQALRDSPLQQLQQLSPHRVQLRLLPNEASTTGQNNAANGDQMEQTDDSVIFYSLATFDDDLVDSKPASASTHAESGSHALPLLHNLSDAQLRRAIAFASQRLHQQQIEQEELNHHHHHHSNKQDDAGMQQQQRPSHYQRQLPSHLQAVSNNNDEVDSLAAHIESHLVQDVLRQTASPPHQHKKHTRRFFNDEEEDDYDYDHDPAGGDEVNDEDYDEEDFDEDAYLYDYNNGSTMRQTRRKRQPRSQPRRVQIIREYLEPQVTTATSTVTFSDASKKEKKTTAVDPGHEEDDDLVSEVTWDRDGLAEDQQRGGHNDGGPKIGLGAIEDTRVVEVDGHRLYFLGEHHLELEEASLNGLQPDAPRVRHFASSAYQPRPPIGNEAERKAALELAEARAAAAEEARLLNEARRKVVRRLGIDYDRVFGINGVIPPLVEDAHQVPITNLGTYHRGFPQRHAPVTSLQAAHAPTSHAAPLATGADSRRYQLSYGSTTLPARLHAYYGHITEELRRRQLVAPHDLTATAQRLFALFAGEYLQPAASTLVSPTGTKSAHLIEPYHVVTQLAPPPQHYLQPYRRYLRKPRLQKTKPTAPSTETTEEPHLSAHKKAPPLSAKANQHPQQQSQETQEDDEALQKERREERMRLLSLLRYQQTFATAESASDDPVAGGLSEIPAWLPKSLLRQIRGDDPPQRQQPPQQKAQQAQGSKVDWLRGLGQLAEREAQQQLKQQRLQRKQELLAAMLVRSQQEGVDSSKVDVAEEEKKDGVEEGTGADGVVPESAVDQSRAGTMAEDSKRTQRPKGVQETVGKRAKTLQVFAPLDLPPITPTSKVNPADPHPQRQRSLATERDTEPPQETPRSLQERLQRVFADRIQAARRVPYDPDRQQFLETNTDPTTAMPAVSAIAVENEDTGAALVGDESGRVGTSHKHKPQGVVYRAGDQHWRSTSVARDPDAPPAASMDTKAPTRQESGGAASGGKGGKDGQRSNSHSYHRSRSPPRSSGTQQRAQEMASEGGSNGGTRVISPPSQSDHGSKKVQQVAEQRTSSSVDPHFDEDVDEGAEAVALAPQLQEIERLTQAISNSEKAHGVLGAKAKSKKPQGKRGNTGNSKRVLLVRPVVASPTHVAVSSSSSATVGPLSLLSNDHDGNGLRREILLWDTEQERMRQSGAIGRLLGQTVSDGGNVKSPTRPEAPLSSKQLLHQQQQSNTQKGGRVLVSRTLASTAVAAGVVNATTTVSVPSRPAARIEQLRAEQSLW